MVWNTGARIVANGLPHGITVVDGEAPYRSITVPAGEVRMWDGTIYPWVDNDVEGLEKSFRVESTADGKVKYYVYQRYSSNEVYFAPAPTGNNVIATPYSAGERVFDSSGGQGKLSPQSNVDIFIMKGRVWALPAGADEAAAQQLLNAAMANDV